MDKKGLLDYSKWMIDSTTARAHKSVAVGIKKISNEPEDRGLGRSRGGFCSKIHLVCDGKGNPLGAVISGGHRHDSIPCVNNDENFWNENFLRIPEEVLFPKDDPSDNPRKIKGK